MKKLIICLFALSLFSGCASIFTGTKQDVAFNTNPPGAKVEADGQVCETPCSLTLPKGGDTVVTITKHGFAPQTFTPSKAFNTVSLWNLLFLPGFIVDLATGAINKVTDDDINMGLTKTAE